MSLGRVSAGLVSDHGAPRRIGRGGGCLDARRVRLLVVCALVGSLMACDPPSRPRAPDPPATFDSLVSDAHGHVIVAFREGDTQGLVSALGECGSEADQADALASLLAVTRRDGDDGALAQALEVVREQGVISARLRREIKATRVKSVSERLRHGALSTMLALDPRDPDVGPWMATGLKSGSQYLRSSALYSVASLPIDLQNEYADVLITALRHGDEFDATAAADSAARFRGSRHEDVVQALLAAARREEWAVRGICASVLRRSGYDRPDVEATIDRLASDRDPRVRDAATK